MTDYLLLTRRISLAYRIPCRRNLNFGSIYRSEKLIYILYLIENETPSIVSIPEFQLNF